MSLTTTEYVIVEWYLRGCMTAMNRSNVKQHKLHSDIKIKISYRIFMRISSHWCRKQAVLEGMIANATARSETANDRTNQLVLVWRRLFMATRYTTKPLPSKVRISKTIKIMMNTSNFMGSEDEDPIAVPFDGDEIFWTLSISTSDAFCVRHFSSQNPARFRL